jgi:hypothetical protein
MKSLALMLIATLLAGCATSSHYDAQREQIAAWERVEIAKAQANARRHDALVAAATGGSDGVRIAAIFAAAGLNGGVNGQTTPVPAITDPQESALRWASIILPSATAITAGYFGYKLGAVASNNAAATSIAGYNAMGGIASAGFASNGTLGGFIQAPAANVTTTTTSTSNTTNTLSGTGVLGQGTYTTRNCNGGSGGSVGNTSGAAGPALGGTC